MANLIPPFWSTFEKVEDNARVSRGSDQLKRKWVQAGTSFVIWGFIAVDEVDKALFAIGDSFSPYGIQLLAAVSFQAHAKSRQ